MCNCNIKHSNFNAQLNRAVKFQTKNSPWGVIFIEGTPYAKPVKSIKNDLRVCCYYKPDAKLEFKKVEIDRSKKTTKKRETKKE
mgnify:CR=1 FL=1